MTLLGLLTAREAAEGVGVTAHTIRQWVRDGLLQPYAKQGRTRLYLARDVVEAQRASRRRMSCLDTDALRHLRSEV